MESAVVMDGVTINAHAMEPDNGMPALEAMEPDNGMPALVVNALLETNDADTFHLPWPGSRTTLVQLLKWYEHCQLGGSMIAHWHISFGEPEFRLSTTTIYRYHHWITEVGHGPLRAWAVQNPGVTVKSARQAFLPSWHSFLLGPSDSNQLQ